MRFIGILITLAIIGYAMHIYLGSSAESGSKPAEYIDQAKQSTDAINKALQNQKNKLDEAN